MAAIHPISTITVGSGMSAALDFNPIPSTYTDLLIVLSTRDGSTTAGFNSPTIKFNNSSANYNFKYLGFAAGGEVSYNYSIFGINILGYQPGSGSLANCFMNTSIYIPNYTSSNYKSIFIDNVYSLNATATNVYWGCSAGLWSQTAAINQFTISAGSFAQHSTATLYGIK